MSSTENIEKKEKRRAETVGLKGGVQYAKVATRLQAFHEDNKACDISTAVELVDAKDGKCVMVRAMVVSERGNFSGTSFGKLSGEKVLEKLETVAVGRALAFAGYSAGGEIASHEEMDQWQDAKDSSIASSFQTKISAANTSEQLTAIRRKISEMVEDDIVSPSSGVLLINMIGERKRQFT